ncbi:MAG: aldolase/citrate lyase family protein [Bacteroidales bacterium]|jgi:citrate lyase subunit beta/citryl-CoA lyase
MRKNKRRTALYIPGHNPAMVQQGGVYGADTVLLDLEDSVALSEKDAARILVRNMIKSIDFYNTEVTVRINHINTPFGLTDLEYIVPVKPEAIRLPKIETKSDVITVIEIIEKIEKKHGIPIGNIKIHPMIETAIGVQNVFEIASAHPRIDAITIGGQDLTADMGIVKTKDNAGLDYARKAIVMAAKANRIDALDSVFADVNDDDGLRIETEYAKKIGFTGKAVINPRQIDIIHDVFNPTDEEIRVAIKIVKAFNENTAKGIGVFALDGRMIDAPVVTRAQHILNLADIDIDDL